MDQPQPEQAHQFQPQAEQQQQPQQQQASPEQGIDPEIAAALNNPKIREALTKEVAAAEQARAAYQQASLQAAQVSAASLLSQYPEIAQMSGEQLSFALKAMALKDPVKAHQLEQHINRTQNLVRASQQAAARQQHMEQSQMQHSMAANGATFEAVFAEREPYAETRKAVRENIFRIAQEAYGIPQADLAHAWKTMPVLHHPGLQLAFADAIKYRLAQQGVADKLNRAAPPAQSPGAKMAARSDTEEDVSRALKAFRADPNPKNAAALLLSRRAAKGSNQE